MGKRSSFLREDRDFYRTPREAVEPLVPFLSRGLRFDEPCAGDGALVRHLESFGFVCAEQTDICPQSEDVHQFDALHIDSCAGECFITNPPWRRDILHPLILRLSAIAQTWLLFDADWAYTKQARPYLKLCRRIVPVGRVKWFPDSRYTGKDNCAWYRFCAFVGGETKFGEY